MYAIKKKPVKHERGSSRKCFFSLKILPNLNDTNIAYHVTYGLIINLPEINQNFDMTFE